jgi:hypothetical protein
MIIDRYSNFMAARLTRHVWRDKPLSFVTNSSEQAPR